MSTSQQMSTATQSGTQIRTPQELQEFGTPTPMVRDKVIDTLHDVHRAWLAATSLVFVATASADGRCDVSPKGDPPGFIRVLDEHTLALPERPGNRRMDGYHNILTNPHAGLVCIIPGREDTLRINGRATVVTNASFMESMLCSGHRPKLALVIDVEEVFFHCPKALRRARAWDPPSWHPEDAPAPADIALALWRSGEPRDAVEARYHDLDRQPLYADD